MKTLKTGHKTMKYALLFLFIILSGCPNGRPPVNGVPLSPQYPPGKIEQVVITSTNNLEKFYIGCVYIHKLTDEVVEKWQASIFTYGDNKDRLTTHLMNFANSIRTPTALVAVVEVDLAVFGDPGTAMNNEIAAYLGKTLRANGYNVGDEF